jgi:hypothetical protein
VRLHPREGVVRKAIHRVSKALEDATDELELTDGEYLMVVGSFFGDRITGFAKHMIRAERHPDDPEKPGGLA